MELMAKIASKKKGNRVELEFAKIFTKRFSRTFKRVPQSGAFSTINKDEGLDKSVLDTLSGDLIPPNGFKFSIEIKSRLDFNFWDLLADETENEIDSWIEQAEGEARITNKEPLIIVKVNRRKPFAIFPEKLKKGRLSYKGYTILRIDYFLDLPDKFFLKEEK
jgi:hypothetical protein